MTRAVTQFSKEQICHWYSFFHWILNSPHVELWKRRRHDSSEWLQFETARSLSVSSMKDSWVWIYVEIISCKLFYRSHETAAWSAWGIIWGFNYCCPTPNNAKERTTSPPCYCGTTAQIWIAEIPSSRHGDGMRPVQTIHVLVVMFYLFLCR